MPAYSMARPSSATPSGATARPIQKLPKTSTAVTRRYAPTANNAPWAKFGMLRTPVISDRPSPIRAYSMPVAIPLRICAATKLSCAGPLEPADVLAGRVFLRQRRIARGDDVGEVGLVLHRRLRLAAHEEVGPDVLVRGRVHAHVPYDVVDLDAFERLHHVLHLGRLGLVEARQQQARHRVGGRGRITRRVAELRLVALDEGLGHRRVGGIVEIRADPDVLADLGRELHEFLHAR